MPRVPPPPPGLTLIHALFFKKFHLDCREMDADPIPEQDPSGINDTTLMDTDNQQKSDMLSPSIGDEVELLSSVENTTAQDNCQSISDVTREDSLDSGNKADDNMESILEDTNVRLKNGCTVVPGGWGLGGYCHIWTI